MTVSSRVAAPKELPTTGTRSTRKGTFLFQYVMVASRPSKMARREPRPPSTRIARFQEVVRPGASAGEIPFFRDASDLVPSRRIRSAHIHPPSHVRDGGAYDGSQGVADDGAVIPGVVEIDGSTGAISVSVEDVLGTAFWVPMIVIAAALVINSRRSRQELGARLMRAAAVIPLVVALDGIVGFAIGGMVGLVGNSVRAFIMATWIGVVWAASGSCAAPKELRPPEGFAS
jgi:hypothetical protein